MSLAHVSRAAGDVEVDAAAPGPCRHALATTRTPAERDALFRQLMKDHRDRLQRLIIRRIGNFDEAEDIAQQAFCEAARTLDRFRGESELSTWLYGIAMNLVRNYLNRSPYRTWRFDSEEALALQASEEPDPEERLYSRQMLQRLSDAMDDLPSEMRDVLTLVGMHDCSYEVAAERLCLPIGTVRSRLSRARAVLRTKLARVGVELPPAYAATGTISASGSCRVANDGHLRPSC